MTIHDISVPIRERMVIYEGNPGVRLTRAMSIADGAGANVSRLELGVHTGTHIDAPLHFIDGAPGSESLELEPLIGPVPPLRLDGSDGAPARAVLVSD